MIMDTLQNGIIAKRQHPTFSRCCLNVQ